MKNGQDHYQAVWPWVRCSPSLILGSLVWNEDNNSICYPTRRWIPFLTVWSQALLAPEAKAFITLVAPLTSVWLPAHCEPLEDPFPMGPQHETFLWAQSLERISLGVWCPTGGQNTFTILWVTIRWGTQSNAAVVMLSICLLPTTYRKRVARENRLAQFSVDPGLFVSFIPTLSRTLLYQSNTHLSPF